MANISRELAAIMSAIYGRDVRQSIHDAIFEVNKAQEEAINAGTTINAGDPATGVYAKSLYFNTSTNELLESDGTIWVAIDNLEGNAITSITGPDPDPINPLIDVYTINFSKAPSQTFNVANGKGIAQITGPVTDPATPLIDTYTIEYTDGTDSQFSITNGKDGADGIDGVGIVSITKTGSSGLVDTYTIEYTDGTNSQFSITNGADGINGSRWYKGTALTGTGSGLTGAAGNVGDFYLNTTDGFVYNCTKSGASMAPDAAEWEYAYTLTGGGGSSTTVVDNLSSYSATEALSANQGRNLNEKKIEKPASPNQNDVLQWDGSDWVASSATGHAMNPTPASTLDEDDVVTAVKNVLAGQTPGLNDEVASVFSIGNWSNTMTKKYIVQGVAGSSTPIGKSGIGKWNVDGSDETGWIYIPELIGIGALDHSINITYDPSKSGIIMRGGYIVDDVTGKMCIKFANEISEADTHTARIGIEITINRTETNPV